MKKQLLITALATASSFALATETPDYAKLSLLSIDLQQYCILKNTPTAQEVAALLQSTQKFYNDNGIAIENPALEPALARLREELARSREVGIAEGKSLEEYLEEKKQELADKLHTSSVAE
jgi:hypothetical protein